MVGIVGEVTLRAMMTPRGEGTGVLASIEGGTVMSTNMVEIPAGTSTNTVKIRVDMGSGVE